MTEQELIRFIAGMDGVLTLRPQPGDDTPEVAWGDSFFYYAPDGVIPRTQPFATIVTKDYPDDVASRLDRPDTFRLNIWVGSAAYRRWVNAEPKDATPSPTDASAADVIVPHPLYARNGWVAVVNPGADTAKAVVELLQSAHDQARRRFHRRDTPQ
ncbi:hypothetical protein J4H86_15145 [Spiractinospora alimapuensis]|uniref:DUF6194 family protein n=1 Tax=Spiractinospora alimapuensis TaxID=2820884 RepID=UPI001F15D6AE|nr:DUF6194 family protein [Spiractinospora alimapuensis]QVQ50287.1 hypothetical protein J4H86_15145 [Spiractinospora alimapuensis]